MKSQHLREISLRLAALLTIFSLLFSAAGPVFAVSVPANVASPEGAQEQTQAVTASAEAVAPQDVVERPIMGSEDAAPSAPNAPQLSSSCQKMGYAVHLWSQSVWTPCGKPGPGDIAAIRYFTGLGIKQDQDVEIGQLHMEAKTIWDTQDYNLKVGSFAIYTEKFYAHNGTVSLLGTSDAFMHTNNISFNNLAMAEPTRPVKIGVGVFTRGAVINVKGDFINGGGPDKMVSFYPDRAREFPTFNPVKTS